MNNFIFGYGSLIEKGSRCRTTPNAEIAFPAEIEGFVRGWWSRTKVVGFSTTFLGCIRDEKKLEREFSHKLTNGVLYKVSEDDLQTTDIREKGYKRELINKELINDYLGLLPDNSNVWIYINVFPTDAILNENLPSNIFPIVQSYVDVCINGCFEIEVLFPLAKQKMFAANFVKSTQCWSSNWANDRIYPRRPFIYCPNAHEIDDLLEEHLMDQTLFRKIYIE